MLVKRQVPWRDVLWHRSSLLPPNTETKDPLHKQETKTQQRRRRGGTSHSACSSRCTVRQARHQDRQSRPINRTGQLTRVPTHHPETENENGVLSRNRRPTRQPRRKLSKSQSKTGRDELKSASAPVQSADRHTSTRKIKTFVQW